MKQAAFTKTVIQALLIITCTIALTVLGLSAVSRYDNKYIAKASLTQEHFSIIPEKGYCALVDGWELYPDVLLSPEDFSSQTRPFYGTWAGEYPNLAYFHADRNPYGTATWRLHLIGNGSVTLYLPEPLCCAKVFADGRCLGGPGEVSSPHYSPFIKDTVYSFVLDGSAELVIQTANYSHYYGGIWYVPVIGDSDSISLLIALRMLLYGMMFFSALTLSLFCIVLWRRKNDRKTPNNSDSASFYFGLFCLSFALRICHPFLKLFGIPFVHALYALEDTAAMSGIYFSIQIIFLLFLPDVFRRIKKALCIVSLGTCVITALVPAFVLPAFPGLVLWYGPFISWYKVLMAVLLSSLIVYGCFMQVPHIKTALIAAAANNVCLCYSVLSVGYHEPFAGAYPEEYGAFIMVIAFACLMVQRSRELTEENQRLNLHLKEEVQEKTEHLQKLLMERGQLISELGHDMKSPLTSLSNMAQIIRLNDIMLDADTHRRILMIEEQCDILSKRLESIQEIAAQTSAPSQMEPVMLNTFLFDFYQNCRPIIELYGPNLLEKITPRPCQIMGNQEQLFRALENLLYNAADFTPPDGNIRLSLSRDDSFAYIRIADTGCGIPKEDLPKIFQRSYTTRSDKGGQGLGLAITHAIILEHAGEITASSKEGEGTVFTIRLPLYPFSI